MSVFHVPQDDKRRKPWPTLGPAVANWMEQNLVHGPGDIRGEPYRLDSEKRHLLDRMYEIYPPGHANEGRRRFRRAAVSVRKGWAKSELAAAIACAELASDSPVRCIGFDDNGQPIGGPVNDPYIPLIASSELQASELVYEAARVMLGDGPQGDRYDIFMDRITRKDGTGKLVSVSAAPKARDGARTTFQVADETHRLVLPRHVEAWRVMLANTAKRKAADPWSLEITTSYDPGEGSVAESTHDYARLVAKGDIPDPSLFFYHREAGEEHDITTGEGLRAAILDASGGAASWSNLDAIEGLFYDPSNDRAMLERLWLNRVVRSTARAFDVDAWKALEDDSPIPDGALVTLGFDGAMRRDATALVACEIETGKLQLLGLWEQPPYADDDWTVPAHEVEAAVDDAFERFDVWRMYADPYLWETYVDKWAGKYGDNVVIFWHTNRWKQIAYAVQAFNNAINDGLLCHTGDVSLTRHIGNCYRRETRVRDDQDNPLWAVQKERKDSPMKIDAAMAAILAFEARGDAVKTGVQPSVYAAENEPAFIVI